ncbi:MAG: hypothetical protein HeimC3_46950 [Candidatus Heimdallarchaeota archaeon LC_3]|nr:MAG: hypothetical protein HeimC3_46950 [Candidatus Heimdallarchaeota archaeon LC_3]
MFSTDYDKYRKKIEGVFQSELDKSPDIDIKRILVILTNPKHHSEFAKVIAELIKHDRAQIKLLNALHFYRSKAEKLGIKVKTLDDLVETIKNENVSTGEIEMVQEGDPFQGICEIVQTSRVDLIIVQYPFAEFLEEEKFDEDSLGKTIESLVSFVMHDTPIPLLIIKKPEKMLEGSYKNVLMVISDWFNARLFKTLIWINRNLKPRVNILPFYKKHVIISEIPPEEELKEIQEKISKIYYDIKYWLEKYAFDLEIQSLEPSMDHFEILNYSNYSSPDLISLYVPRKPEEIPLFQEIVRKIHSNILIVPEFDDTK